MAWVFPVVLIAGLMLSKMAVANEDQRNWDLSIGLGAIYAPDYIGANVRSPRLRVWADGAYRMDRAGTIKLDSGSLTIAPEVRWDFVDSLDAGIGPLVGYRAGRNDHNPSFTSANDGSTQLMGLPNVSGTPDAGVAAHISVFGIPLFAQVRTALHGTQGTVVNTGMYLLFKPAADFELTVLPTLSWSNSRQMDALFGISETAAATSGFAQYSPNAGWTDTAVEIGGDWHVRGGWHFLVSGAYQRLLGNAARSPLVRSANQPSALAGISLDF